MRKSVAIKQALANRAISRVNKFSVSVVQGIDSAGGVNVLQSGIGARIGSMGTVPLYPGDLALTVGQGLTGVQASVGKAPFLSA